MRSAVVIRHVHFEDLGAFAAPFESAGIQGLSVGRLRADARRHGPAAAAAGRRCLAAWLDGLR